MATRTLSIEEERVTGGAFTKVTTREVVLEKRGRRVVVPTGFLTDGASCALDAIGETQYLVHDYLYAHHQGFTRVGADWFCFGWRYVWRFLGLQAAWWVSARAWRTSGDRGALFLGPDGSLCTAPPVHTSA